MINSAVSDFFQLSDFFFHDKSMNSLIGYSGYRMPHPLLTPNQFFFSVVYSVVMNSKE